MIYRQLLLDLHRSQIPSFDNFVPGANAELLERLRQLAEPQETDALYLWGPAGSGRSHLLRAAVDAHALGLADANQNQIAIQLQPFVVDAGRGPYVDDNYDFGAHAKGDDNDRATLSQVATFTATESAYCRGH
mgnify:CR=1 FL=1